MKLQKLSKKQQREESKKGNNDREKTTKCRETIQRRMLFDDDNDLKDTQRKIFKFKISRTMDTLRNAFYLISVLNEHNTLSFTSIAINCLVVIFFSNFSAFL